MDPRTVRVFTACAMGALVGTLVALQLSPYLWWFGLLAGAGIGYLAFEFRKVTVAVPAAWQHARTWGRMKREKMTPWDMAIVWCGRLLSVLTLLPFFMVGPISQHTTSVISEMKSLMTSLPWIALFVLVWSFGEIVINRDLAVVNARFNIRYMNPVMFYVYYPLKFVFYWLPKGVIWTVPRIPDALIGMALFVWELIVTVGRFFKFLFLEIHSDLRVLCAVDAAIGTAIGYAAGNALIGAVAGGLFGVLNYEVVSKKVLGLVPKKEA